MTTTARTGAQSARERFGVAGRAWPYVRMVVAGLLPCPDVVFRYRMRRAAFRLVDLAVWPDDVSVATGEMAAQLVMLRMLYLQQQVRRAVRGRHREASVMLARSCVELLLLGVWCLSEPSAVSRLDAGGIKAVGDAVACLGDLGIAPEPVIRECLSKLGAGRSSLGVFDMADAIDRVNGNKAATGIYRRLYVPLSNFTIHAGGLSLIRHVGRASKLRRRPSHAWNRRSPARVADAATGFMAAALAGHKKGPKQQLMRYARRHERRALLPIAFIGITGVGRSSGPGQILRAVAQARSLYHYLNRGAGPADPLDVRTARVRTYFAQAVEAAGTGVPAGSLDPLIEYLADMTARSYEPSLSPAVNQ